MGLRWAPEGPSGQRASRFAGQGSTEISPEARESFQTWNLNPSGLPKSLKLSANGAGRCNWTRGSERGAQMP